MIHRKRTTLTALLSAFLLMFVFVGCSAVPQNGDSGTADREDVPTTPTDMNLADRVNQPMDSPTVDVANPEDVVSMDAEQDVQNASDVLDVADVMDGTLFDGTSSGDVVDAQGRDVPMRDNVDVVATDSTDAADGAGVCTLDGDWESAAPIAGSVPGFRFGAMARAFAARTYAELSVPGRAAPMGDYAVAGAQVTLSNDNGVVFGCNMANVGRYQLTFSADCDSVRFTVIADDCVIRRSVMDGIVLRRGMGGVDAGVGDGGDASAADGGVIGMCSIPTDWRLDAGGGITFFLRFTLMGTWQAAQAQANLGGPLAIALGNWALMGNRIILTNDPGASGCAPADRGEYTVSFNADCSRMQWMLVADTCMARTMAFQQPFVRLP